MLIINADDLGRNKTATNNTIQCFEHGAITSASAMVFMADSERAAKLALEKKLDVGLHLNLDERFTVEGISQSLHERHNKVVSFLSGSKFSFLIYNPFLRHDFEYLFKVQYEEFSRLYGKIPSRIDGHHHLHLCMNMLIDRIIPKGLWVRRNFTFSRGEKPIFNRLYRHIIDRQLLKRYQCIDFSYSLNSKQNIQNRLHKIIEQSKTTQVELLTHPEIKNQFTYLTSPEYLNITANANIGTFTDI